MKKEVVIIGGGFAGINLAKKLCKNAAFHITLVDKNNYNFFPPLLYQVATGFLEVSNISYPYRKFLHGRKNINFQMGTLLRVIPQTQQVILSSGALHYDYLVLATGTESNYFGLENVMKHALPMKTIDDAIELRNTLLQNAEAAANNAKKGIVKGMDSIVVAGGGPTGVEVAGMLAEMSENILGKDYPEFKDRKVKIHLVDGAPTLLGPMSKKSQSYTYDALIKMGVDVQLNKQVKDYVDGAVVFADGEKIRTRLLIWTAGVTAKRIEGIPAESYGRGQRLIVDAYNQIKGMENIFAIGDTCLQTSDAAFPGGHPQLAQVAIQQGKNLANNLSAALTEKPMHVFQYHDKGSMAIIGRSKAVANLPRPKLDITGWLAWAMWLFVHLFSLINYRNRIKTMYNWTTAYFTKDQALRMIIRPGTKPSSERKQQQPLAALSTP